MDGRTFTRKGSVLLHAGQSSDKSAARRRAHGSRGTTGGALRGPFQAPPRRRINPRLRAEVNSPAWETGTPTLCPRGREAGNVQSARAACDKGSYCPEHRTCPLGCTFPPLSAAVIPHRKGERLPDNESKTRSLARSALSSQNLSPTIIGRLPLAEVALLLALGRQLGLRRERQRRLELLGHRQRVELAGIPLDRLVQGVLSHRPTSGRDGADGRLTGEFLQEI